MSTHDVAADDEVSGRRADEAMDAYVDWREERAGVWDAYARWESAGHGDAPFAFSAYLAALDREERASCVYAERVTQIFEAAREHELGAPHRRMGLW